MITLCVLQGHRPCSRGVLSQPRTDEVSSVARQGRCLDPTENTAAMTYSRYRGDEKGRADGYVGRDHTGEAADFRAARADVSGLPPTYISVGGLDLFLEENMIYADRLSRAGVPVELHMYPRAYHGFYRVTNARVTKQAEHDNREALRRFLHG